MKLDKRIATIRFECILTSMLLTLQLKKFNVLKPYCAGYVSEWKPAEPRNLEILEHFVEALTKQKIQPLARSGKISRTDALSSCISTPYVALYWKFSAIHHKSKQEKSYHSYKNGDEVAFIWSIWQDDILLQTEVNFNSVLKIKSFFKVKKK